MNGDRMRNMIGLSISYNRWGDTVCVKDCGLYRILVKNWYNNFFESFICKLVSSHVEIQKKIKAWSLKTCSGWHVHRHGPMHGHMQWYLPHAWHTCNGMHTCAYDGCNPWHTVYKISIISPFPNLSNQS